MKMYIWRSKMLKCWADGQIFVIAETLEEAKKEATKGFTNYMARCKDWIEITDEDYAYHYSLFTQDISQTPRVIEKGAYFVKGSD